MSLTGATVTLIDFRKPLAKRKRTVCGPYFFKVPARDARRDGCGFYFGPDGQPARHGAGFRLRMEQDGAGFYGMPMERDSLVLPYVASLPHGRGFLAACGEGAEMWGLLDYTVHETREDAARAASEMARCAADRIADEQAAQDARDRADWQDAEFCSDDFV